MEKKRLTVADLDQSRKYKVMHRSAMTRLYEVIDADLTPLEAAGVILYMAYLDATTHEGYAMDLSQAPGICHLRGVFFDAATGKVRLRAGEIRYMGWSGLFTVLPMGR